MRKKGKNQNLGDRNKKNAESTQSLLSPKVNTEKKNDKNQKKHQPHIKFFDGSKQYQKIDYGNIPDYSRVGAYDVLNQLNVSKQTNVPGFKYFKRDSKKNIDTSKNKDIVEIKKNDDLILQTKEKEDEKEEKLGFKSCIIPESNKKLLKDNFKLDIIGVKNINEAMEKLNLK